MKLEGKECKVFISKIIKQMNSILRYNTESVLMCQIQNENDKMDIIFVTKSMPISFDIFNYMKEVYVENEVYTKAVKHISRSLIKHKKDSSSYGPMIISTENPISLINIEENDLVEKKFVFPVKYNKFANFSDSFFIIPDLFKSFNDNHIISGIDDDFHLYDENNCRYDTSGFLFPIKEISERAKDFIKKYSPNRFFPISVNKDFNEEKDFINNEIKEMIIKLNSAVCNYEYKEMIFDKDVVILSSDETEYDIFINKLKENGVSYLENKLTGEKTLIFDEFFKGKNKTIFSTSCRRKELLSDGITNVPVVHAGLVFKNKDLITYLFYKYFEYDSIEQKEEENKNE